MKSSTKMSRFLAEFADLMDKYDISMEVMDDGTDYYPTVDGIEFCAKSDDYCTSGSATRSRTCLNYINADDIREINFKQDEK